MRDDFEPPIDPNAETVIDLNLSTQPMHGEGASQCPYHHPPSHEAADDNEDSGLRILAIFFPEVDIREEKDGDDEELYQYPEFTRDMDTGYP